MPCYSPIPIKKNWNTLTKKWELTFLPHRTKNDVNFKPYEQHFIKCSRCIGCRLSHVKQWSERCSLEAQDYNDNYFITLTYNDNYLPLTKKTKKSTLYKKHVQNFIKQIRQHYKRHFNHIGIRFFGSGEYGKKGRPHYHINFFNLPIPDLKKFGQNSIKNNYYTSNIISKYWKYGFILIGQFSSLTAAYTARYTLKKITKNNYYKSKYKENGNLKIKIYDPEKDIQPEYIFMSTNPGIAYNYLIKNMYQIYKNNSILIKTDKKNYYIKPFSYYNRKIKEVDPLFIKNIQEKNQIITQNKLKNKLENSDQSFLDLLKNEQILLHKKINSLIMKRF